MVIYAYLFDSFKTECEKEGIKLELKQRVRNNTGLQCYLYKDSKQFNVIIHNYKGKKIVYKPDILEIESIMNIQIINNLKPVYQNI